MLPITIGGGEGGVGGEGGGQVEAGGQEYRNKIKNKVLLFQT